MPTVRAPAIFGVALAITGAAAGLLQWRASTGIVDVGIAYGPHPLMVPLDVSERLGGPLSDSERQQIREVARAELVRAFTRFRVRVVEGRRGFWRVVIHQGGDEHPRQYAVYPPGLASAGEARSFGPLGGTGLVDFNAVARHAVRLAPARATRGLVLAGIGRGLGRVAAHEVVHQILGAEPGAHNPADESAYEFPSPDRAAQYYGVLRWTTALAPLERRLGRGP
jgi:hypothetical protein